MGSFKDKSFNPTQKIILAEYETWEEALEAEVLLHEFYDVARNPHFANRAKQTCTGFSRAGVKDSDETKRRKRNSHIGLTHTSESIERMRQVQQARTNRPSLSNSHKEKISKALKGTKQSKEWCEKRLANDAKTKRYHWRKEWWDAVADALSKAESKLWGKQAILDKFDVKERTLRKMRNLIEAGVTWEEAIEGARVKNN